MSQNLLPAAALLVLLVGAGRNGEDSAEIIEEFITNYHRSPVPARVPQMLDLILRLKVLASPTFEDSKGRILIAHAFGHMAHGNSKLVRLYESRFDTAGHRGRILLLRALRVCADDATVKLLEKWARHPAYAEQRPDIGATRAF